MCAFLTALKPLGTPSISVICPTTSEPSQADLTKTQKSHCPQYTKGAEEKGDGVNPFSH